MKSPYIENLYFKKSTDHHLRNYKKKNSYSKFLQKREKKLPQYPFFSNKGGHRGNIKLGESKKSLQDDISVAEELKDAVSTLDINKSSYIIKPDPIDISDPIEKPLRIKRGLSTIFKTSNKSI